MNPINIFKIFGIFSTLIILGIFLSGSIIGVAQGIKNGDIKQILTASGGRLFMMDYGLREETNWLLNQTAEGVPPDTDFYVKSQVVFHIAYCFVLLFMLFVILYMLFRFGNWIMGIRQFSPGTDIFIALMIFVLYFVIEFLYVQFVLHETLIPIYDGVIYFLINLPKIITNII